MSTRNTPTALIAYCRVTFDIDVDPPVPTLVAQDGGVESVIQTHNDLVSIVTLIEPFDSDMCEIVCTLDTPDEVAEPVTIVADGEAQSVTVTQGGHAPAGYRLSVRQVARP